MLMEIFFSCCHPTSDMSFWFIHVQHFSCLLCQRGIDLKKPFGDVFMYRTLTYPELLRSLSHRRTIFYNIVCDFHRPLLNIISHGKARNPDRGNGTVRASGRMVEAKIKARCRFGCRAGCRSGCRAKIPKALILRHFSLSDNHDNQYYKEKGNSKKIVSPDKEKRFSDVRCRNFVVRPFLVGLFSFN